jgi:predicted RNA-binding Zn ribbon-like protein
VYQQKRFCQYTDGVQSIAEMPFIAGHVALDFVNTAEERGHPDAADAVRTPEDLRLWGQRYGLLSSRPEGHEDDDRAELRRALEARELLYALFFARVHSRCASPADRNRLAALAATAYRAGSLEPAPTGELAWRWPRSELATIRHVAVTAGVQLLGTEPSERLKQCPGEHCGWFFFDATKRGNRRWCSMSECGQEAKSMRRRTRSQAS